MRVLMYVSTEEWTATSRTMLTAARGLVARGHSVTIACCSGSQLEARSREAGIETDVIDGAWFGTGGAWDLRKVLQSRFIEVAIVSNDRDHRIVASAMRFAERGSVLRRIPPFEPVDLSDSSKLSLKLAPSGLLFTSETEFPTTQPPGWIIPSMAASVGIDPTTYDAVEPITRADFGAPPEGLLIACDYHPSGRNRIGDLFRALALLAPRHAHLHAVIFGPGSAEDDIRLHASALGVGRVVSFLGERADSQRLMRTADAGWVVAGGDEGAYSFLEFMALRVPIIAERWPLAQHFVADNITGVLLAPGDPPHTASVVADFLSRADKRVAMGNAGRVRVARDFPESAMIDGFEKAVTVAGDRTAWPTT